MSLNLITCHKTLGQPVGFFTITMLNEHKVCDKKRFNIEDDC